MATSLPSDPTKTNLDEANDDPKQGRGDLDDLVDNVVAILGALGTASLYNLASSGGLTVDAKAVGVNDELKIKVQTNGGIALESSGIRLNINGLATFASPSLATDDTFAVYDSSEGDTVRRSLAGILSDIAGTGLTATATQLQASTQLDFQEFDSSDTWTKPSNGTVVFVQCWGGGGGGSSDDVRDSGGGGGGYAAGWFQLSDLGGTESVTIGAGGAVDNTGGNTSFGSWLTAYGGGAGSHNGGSAAASGGGGGGSYEKGTSGGNGGAIGGGNGGATGGEPSTIESGGGGGGMTSGGSIGNGANAIWGGAGGATGTAGTSIHGGDGGTAGVAGTQPGGGGGRSAAGGDGRIRVTVF